MSLEETIRSGFRKRGRRNSVASDFVLSSVFFPFFRFLSSFFPFFLVLFLFSSVFSFRFFRFIFRKKKKNRGDTVRETLLRNPDSIS